MENPNTCGPAPEQMPFEHAACPRCKSPQRARGTYQFGPGPGCTYDAHHPWHDSAPASGAMLVTDTQRLSVPDQEIALLVSGPPPGPAPAAPGVIDALTADFMAETMPTVRAFILMRRYAQHLALENQELRAQRVLMADIRQQLDATMQRQQQAENVARRIRIAADEEAERRYRVARENGYSAGWEAAAKAALRRLRRVHGKRVVIRKTAVEAMLRVVGRSSR